MSFFNTEVARCATSANLAQELIQAALAEFDAYCRSGDYALAEEARLKVVSNMEVYLDNIAAMHHKLQKG